MTKVLLRSPDDVSVIETSTNTVVETVSAGNGPRFGAFTVDGSALFVANDHDGLTPPG